MTVADPDRGMSAEPAKSQLRQMCPERAGGLRGAPAHLQATWRVDRLDPPRLGAPCAVEPTPLRWIEPAGEEVPASPFSILCVCADWEIVWSFHVWQ